jgi:selenocysteine-specific elongation factor
MYVIGTAGHVDHGKTALIQALTGIDTDRLPEEKERGLTIDLGFAHFDGDDGDPVGVVDVPGHERFIRNMVAGAVNLDCAILVVAADEAWMKQTTDHTRVLALLEVETLVVAVTKCDLVDDATAEQVRADAVAHAHRIGGWNPSSALVSAHTGDGLDELKLRVFEALGKVQSTQSDAPRLDIDRVFTVQGAGTVVTGTLRDGELHAHQEVQVLPAGIAAHIRSIQTYNTEVSVAVPASRVALNLRGANPDEVLRGMVVVSGKSDYESVNEIVIQLRDSAGSDGGESWPQNKTRLKAELAIGSGHVLVDAALMPNPTLVRIVSPSPIALRYRQPCVLIRHGGSKIIGGGSVIWRGSIGTTHRKRLSQVFQSKSAESLNEDQVRLRVIGYAPWRTGDTHDDTSGATKVRGEWIFFTDLLISCAERIREAIRVRGGKSIDELSKYTGVPVEPLGEICALLIDGGKIERVGNWIVLPKTAAEESLSPLGRKLLKDLREADRTGIEPAKVRISGAKKELNTLCSLELAKSLGGVIYYELDVYHDVIAQLLDGLAPGTILTISDARDRTGLTRKYVIPLFSRMEADALVRRDGDVRVVL